MIHDEKTTEIEMPIPSSNIVHVNFHGTKRAPQRTEAGPLVSKASTPPMPTSMTHFQSHRAFDLRTPWIVRVLALVSILVLSLLVL